MLDRELALAQHNELVPLLIKKDVEIVFESASIVDVSHETLIIIGGDGERNIEVIWYDSDVVLIQEGVDRNSFVWTRGHKDYIKQIAEIVNDWIP